MHAPLQKLGTPREQLQPGFHCTSSRDTPPALQPYDHYVRMFVCLFASVSLLHRSESVVVFRNSRTRPFFDFPSPEAACIR